MLKECVYSVLIVSSFDKFNTSIARVLPTHSFSPVEIATSGGMAKRLLLEKNYDIVIINSPLPDEYGIDFAIQVATNTNSGVLLFVKSNMFDEAFDKTNGCGVLTIMKPTSGEIVIQSLRLLCSTIEKINKLNNNQTSLQLKLEEIRLVNNAKLLLIEHKHMSEAEAHRFIEKRAMDFRITKMKCALQIINEYHKA